MSKHWTSTSKFLSVRNDGCDFQIVNVCIVYLHTQADLYRIFSIKYMSMNIKVGALQEPFPIFKWAMNMAVKFLVYSLTKPELYPNI